MSESGQNRKSVTATRMSGVGGEADEIGTKADSALECLPLGVAGVAVGIVLEYSKPE